MSNWTDELKASLVKQYEAESPTAETSMEIITALNGQDEFSDFTPAGMRMILVKQGVYVAKAPAAAKSSSGGGGARVSKEASQQALADAISASGLEPDMGIISKLTGKAAVYLTTVLTAQSDDD